MALRYEGGRGEGRYGQSNCLIVSTGGVAQMVERSLSMREVRGSIPRASINLFVTEGFLFYITLLYTSSVKWLVILRLQDFHFIPMS